MLFQNTSVTRGTGTIVVTATGMNTEVGRIAAMLSEVSRTRSPLQLQLDDLTKKIGDRRVGDPGDHPRGRAGPGSELRRP